MENRSAELFYLSINEYLGATSASSSTPMDTSRRASVSSSTWLNTSPRATAPHSASLRSSPPLLDANSQIILFAHPLLPLLPPLNLHLVLIPMTATGLYGDPQRNAILPHILCILCRHFRQMGNGPVGKQHTRRWVVLEHVGLFR